MTITLIFLFAVLAGVADACMDIRRDNVPTPLAWWFGNWFFGGNDKYTLPIWGPYDFWHFAKSCMMACWTVIAYLAFRCGGLSTVAWWIPMLGALIVYWLEGITFYLFYHYILRSQG